jgi:hypothetical protein
MAIGRHNDAIGIGCRFFNIGCSFSFTMSLETHFIRAFDATEDLPAQD